MKIANVHTGAGALLLVPAFFLGWAAVGIPLAYRPNTSLPMLLVSAASLWGAFFCVSISWRLLTHRRRPDGGLLSPPFLTGAGVLLAAIPFIVLATGSWRSETHPTLTLVLVLLHIPVSIAVFWLAWKDSTRTKAD